MSKRLPHTDIEFSAALESSQIFMVDFKEGNWGLQMEGGKGNKATPFSAVVGLFEEIKI